MTYDEMLERADRRQVNGVTSYDLRSFGAEQQGAVAVFLGHLVFRKNLSGVVQIGKLEMVVDETFQLTSQLDGFIKELAPLGLMVFITRVDTSGPENEALRLAALKAANEPLPPTLDSNVLDMIDGKDPLK